MANDIFSPGEFDALEKAREGEPIFLLLGRDPAAPACLALWCDIRRKLARGIEDKEKRKEELLQVAEAEHIGWDMDDYRKGREVLVGQRVNYLDTAIDNPQSIEIAKLIRATKHLGESAAHVQSAIELLDELGLLGSNEAGLISCREAIQAIRAIYDLKEGQRSYSKLPDPGEFGDRPQLGTGEAGDLQSANDALSPDQGANE